MNLFVLAIFPYEPYSLTKIGMISILNVFEMLGNALKKMDLCFSSGKRTTHPGQSQVWTEFIQFSKVEESLNSIWYSSV